MTAFASAAVTSAPRTSARRSTSWRAKSSSGRTTRCDACRRGSDDRAGALRARAPREGDRRERRRARAPPLPPPTARRAGAARERAVSGRSPRRHQRTALVPDEPVLPLPDLHALRARIAAVAATVGTRVPDGSKVDIAGLSVKLDVGGEPFAFGPGPFTMERTGDSFASRSRARRRRPRRRSRSTPSCRSRPATSRRASPAARSRSRSSGVKEGTKGLFNVSRGIVSGKGQVVLSAAGDALTFDGQSRSARSRSSSRASRPSRCAASTSPSARAASSTMRKAPRRRRAARHGRAPRAHARNRRGVAQALRPALGVEIAPASCQSLLDSTPQGLLPTVRSARMTGTFGATSAWASTPAARQAGPRVPDRRPLQAGRGAGRSLPRSLHELVHVPHGPSRRHAGETTHRARNPAGPSSTTSGRS